MQSSLTVVAAPTECRANAAFEFYFDRFNWQTLTILPVVRLVAGCSGLPARVGWKRGTVLDILIIVRGGLLVFVGSVIFANRHIRAKP